MQYPSIYVHVNSPAPNSAPSESDIPSVSTAPAANETITSGAPLARASNVTPAKA